MRFCLSLRNTISRVSLLLFSALAPHAALAGLLGTYIGIGAGQANIKMDRAPSTLPLSFSEKPTGWKAVIGLRPISPIGAELDYIDFGKASATLGPAAPIGTLVQADAKARAAALFAVGYLPLPIPWFDIFGKVGVARLESTDHVVLPALVCVAAGCNDFRLSRNDTQFAWGVGAQLKLPGVSLAVRAEYERFGSSNGDPNLASLSLLWRF